MKIQIASNGYVIQLGVFDFYLVHGLILGVTWSALALLQIAAARWLKMYHKASMWAHRISGFIVFLTTFIMAMLTLSHEGWELEDGLHNAMGLTILITMSLLTIGGITARIILERSKWNTVLALRIKLGHKVFGWVVIFLAQITVLLGGMAYEETGHPLAETLVIVEIVLFFILVIAFETLFRIYRKKEQPFREIA